MIISQNVDANTEFLFTVGADNKKIEIVPANTVLFTQNPYDFSNLPNGKDDPAAQAAILAEQCKREEKCNLSSNLRPLGSRAFSQSINRPNGILTTNVTAAQRRRERAEALASLGQSRAVAQALAALGAAGGVGQGRCLRQFNNLSLATLENVPRVRMIDRRIPTIATGVRGPELFPAGTRTNSEWIQEEPGRPVRRLSLSERDRILNEAVLQNRARILRNINENGRLRVAPPRKRRTRCTVRPTFPII
jgi:hypothetical protein